MLAIQQTIHWHYISIVSGNGLAPEDEPMLTMMSDALWHHQATLLM